MPSKRKSTSRSLSPSARQRQKLYSLLTFLALVFIYFVLDTFIIPAFQPSELPTELPGADRVAGLPSENGDLLPAWVKVYFTSPDPPDDLNRGIDRYVLSAFDGAAHTIDVVSFDINLPSVVGALIDAHERGVQVRVVYDGEEGDAEVDNDFVGLFNGIDELDDASIPMVDGGRSNGLMHDKFIIVDSHILFVGSWNISYNDTYRNNNNVLEITAPQIIANYQAKFDEMFMQELFGTHAEVGPPNPMMVLDGVAVENYFSPPDEVMEKLVQYVSGARESIHFYVFTYTHPDLSAAMIERFRNGVDVQGVIENRGASRGALVPLYCAKVPAKIDGNKYTMHHKVIVIDSETVITGSFNFTKSADNINDDNILVIHSSALAKLYEEEYQRMWSIAGDPNPENVVCE